MSGLGGGMMVGREGGSGRLEHGMDEAEGKMPRWCI